jgi:hypothetical protein
MMVSTPTPSTNSHRSGKLRATNGNDMGVVNSDFARKRRLENSSELKIGRFIPPEPINSAPPPENTADIRAELREISGTPSCDEPLVSFCEARSDPRLLGNLADRRRR